MSVDLSIIIVNYNVQHFLNQCLTSVKKAAEGLNTEIIVVDNNSVDGSVHMVRERFPDVKVLDRKTNDGFSVANNEGISTAKGKYILLLNPDTVVQEDTFKICLDHMESYPSTGALGVKMIDGSGNFLPESKRGFPTVWASLCKFSGLSRLFPKSAVFNSYYLGHLDKNSAHKIDVLCGAFMFIRKTILDQIGYLDESFFMYGEDIDLSYRISEAGYAIEYIPDTCIIHYKGESTKKASFSHVSNFYRAMIIFSRKHQRGSWNWLKIGCIRLFVTLIAGITLFKRWTQKGIWLFIDFIGIVAVVYSFSKIWAIWYYQNPEYYSEAFIALAIGMKATILCFSLYVYGNYDKKTSTFDTLRGWFVGVIGIIVLYALLPEHFRPSRMILMVGSILALISTFIFKLISLRITSGEWTSRIPLSSHTLIVATKEVSHQIKKLLYSVNDERKIVGVICPVTTNDSFYINDITKLKDVTRSLSINEIIFSAESLDYQSILNHMMSLGDGLNFKIAGYGNTTILGSFSKNTPGELITYDLSFKIDGKVNRRIKAISNVLITLVAFFLSPVLYVFSGFNNEFWSGLIQNMMFKAHWVGYDPKDEQLSLLPKLKKGVIPVSIQLGKRHINQSERHQINTFYALNYGMFADIKVVAYYLSQRFFGFKPNK